jgi:hypothetical protein
MEKTSLFSLIEKKLMNLLNVNLKLILYITLGFFVFIVSCQFNPNAPFNVVKCDDSNVTGSNTQQCWDKWLMKRLVMLVPLIQSGSTTVSTVSSSTTEVTPLVIGLPSAIQEGSSATVSVKLSKAITEPKSVVIQSNLVTAFTVNDTNTATLTFTSENWSTEQTFTLQSISDTNNTNETASISFSITGSTPLIYNVTSIEPATNVSGTTNAFFLRNVPSEIAEGTAHTVYVSISVKSTENRTVTITSNSPIFTVNGATSTATLTFTTVNATVEQSFTVHSLIDGNQADETGTITLSYGNESTTLTIINKDTPGNWINITSISLVEGNKGSITAKLAQKPHENVVVAFTSSYSALTIDNPSLTFTPENWSTEQTLNLTGAIDTNTVSETVAITGTTPNISNAGYVTYQENGIIITKSSDTLIETQSVNVSVKLSKQPGNDTTVSLSITAHSSISFNPTTLTFTSANWNTVQTSTISSAAFTPDTAILNTAPDPLVVSAGSDGMTSSTVNFRFQPIKEVYTWGTFTDNLNGTIKFIGANAYSGQTLTWMKCSQGQMYDSINHICTGTIGTYQFCSTATNDCNNGNTSQLLGSSFLNGSTSSSYDTCNSLIFVGKTGWRLPVIDEMRTLIHCLDKTLLIGDATYNSNGTGCGNGNYNSPTISKLFPNTSYSSLMGTLGYRTSNAYYADSQAYVFFFNDGKWSGIWGKTINYPVRCVLSGQ